MGTKRHPIIIKVILFIYVLYSFMPAVAYYVPSYIRIVLALIVVFYFLPRVSFRWLPIIIIPLLTLIGYALNSPSRFFPHLYYVFNIGVLGALSYSLVTRDEIALSRQIVVLLVISFVINSITTLYGNIRFPNASRVLASITLVAENYDNYRRQNIGGFDEIYSFTLSIPLAAIVFMKKKGILRILSLSVAVLFLFTIIKSDYTTALVFAVLSFLLFFFPLKTKNRTIIIVISLIVAFLLLGDSINVFSFISRLSGSDAVSNRMSDLSDWLQSGQLNDNSDVSGRFGLYMISLKGFLTSPIIGNLTSKETMVGGHSFILDNLSTYGLIGIISLLLMYSAIYNLNCKFYSKTDFFYFAIFIYVVYLFLTFLNPQPFIPFISFALPLFFYVFNQ